MEKLKKYLPLHLTVMLFSFTSVFSKFASRCFNAGGISSIMLYVYLFLMLLTCAIYALAWQKVIKHVELNVAYANRTVYLIWSQVWAVAIFKENLSVNNIIGMVIVFIGVLVVVFHE